jgi:clathrin heavy chain
VSRDPSDVASTFDENLVAEVQKRQRLQILKSSFLESRANEGAIDPHVHNGLAMLYIDSNNGAANFLTTNKSSDSAVDARSGCH